MRRLEGAELAHEGVVLGVRHLGPVERVVEVVVAGDQLPKLVDALPGRCGNRHRGEDNTPERGRSAADSARKPPYSRRPARAFRPAPPGHAGFARTAFFSILSLPSGASGRRPGIAREAARVSPTEHRPPAAVEGERGT